MFSLHYDFPLPPLVFDEADLRLYNHRSHLYPYWKEEEEKGK